MIRLNALLIRGGLKNVENTLTSSIKSDIAKYKRLSSKLARSKSGFNTELKEALDAEAMMLEDTAEVYEAIISFLYKATEDLERLDRGLIRG